MTATCGAVLHARPVESASDLERMRVIRNASRHWFTRDTDEIQAERQHDWWLEFAGRGYVYEDCAGAVVGYGLITHNGWVSVAVDPAEHGQGYGTAIFADLAARGGSRAEVRPDNVASLRAAQKAGFIPRVVPGAPFVELVTVGAAP